MINSTDLRKHALSTVAFGYSKKQTDAVLDLAADTIDRMAAEIIHLNRLLGNVEATDD